MPKKDIGFRFSEEVHAKLLDLSEKSGMTRTRIIEESILTLAVDKDGNLIRRDGRFVVTDDPPVIQRSLVEEEHPAAQAGVPSAKALTREEREAKIAAFQRKMAKGKK